MHFFGSEYVNHLKAFAHNLNLQTDYSKNVQKQFNKISVELTCGGLESHELVKMNDKYQLDKINKLVAECTKLSALTNNIVNIYRQLQGQYRRDAFVLYFMHTLDLFNVRSRGTMHVVGINFILYMYVFANYGLFKADANAVYVCELTWYSFRVNCMLPLFVLISQTFASLVNANLNINESGIWNPSPTHFRMNNPILNISIAVDRLLNRYEFEPIAINYYLGEPTLSLHMQSDDIQSLQKFMTAILKAHSNCLGLYLVSRTYKLPKEIHDYILSNSRMKERMHILNQLFKLKNVLVVSGDYHFGQCCKLEKNGKTIHQIITSPISSDPPYLTSPISSDPAYINFFLEKTLFILSELLLYNRIIDNDITVNKKWIILDYNFLKLTHKLALFKCYDNSKSKYLWRLFKSPAKKHI